MTQGNHGVYGFFMNSAHSVLVKNENFWYLIKLI